MADINKITEGLTGQEAADIIYENDSKLNGEIGIDVNRFVFSKNEISNHFIKEIYLSGTYIDNNPDSIFVLYSVTRDHPEVGWGINLRDITHGTENGEYISFDWIAMNSEQSYFEGENALKGLTVKAVLNWEAITSQQITFSTDNILPHYAKGSTFSPSVLSKQNSMAINDINEIVYAKTDYTYSEAKITPRRGAELIGDKLTVTAGKVGYGSRIETRYIPVSRYNWSVGDTVTFLLKLKITNISLINPAHLQLYLFKADGSNTEKENLNSTTNITKTISGEYLTVTLVRIILATDEGFNVMFQMGGSDTLTYTQDITISLESAKANAVYTINRQITAIKDTMDSIVAGIRVVDLYAYADDTDNLGDSVNTGIFRGKINNISSIQRAINSITDASSTKCYIINCIGSFIATSLEEFSVFSRNFYNVVALPNTDYISLRGQGIDRTVISGDLPDDLDIDYSRYQVVQAEGNHCNISDMSIVGQNVRYPVHTDQSGNGGNANYLQCWENVCIEHKGNTGKAAASWNSYHPLGLGIASGQVVQMKHCILKSPSNPVYLHSNKGFSESYGLILENCQLVNTSSNLIACNIAPLSANRAGEILLKGISALGFIVDTGRVYSDKEIDFAPDINDCIVKGYGNSLIGFIGSKHACQLRITVNDNTAEHKVKFDINSNAYPIIAKGESITKLGDYGHIYESGYVRKDGGAGFNAWALGLKLVPDVCGSGRDVTTYSLANRLGDCSVNNKTLGIIIDDTIHDIVFDKNYIGLANADVLADINAALSGFATADIWSLSNDCYMNTDRVTVLKNTSDSAILNGSVVALSVGVKLCSSNDKVYGVALDDAVAGMPLRILTGGLIPYPVSSITNTYGAKRFIIRSTTQPIKGKRYAPYNGVLEEDESGVFFAIDTGIIGF